MSGETKGIVVLGFPRSGTTLLRKILDAHPEIACPGETCILSSCSRFLESEVVADGLEFGVLNGLAFAGFAPEETLAELRDFAFGFHRRYAAAQDKRRWAEKTAIDVFHLANIEKMCGDSVQYVCVVRHGLDVACSVREFSERGFGYLPEIHDYVRQYARPLEAFAHAWTEKNRELHEFLGRQGENAILLRYEDLVADPVSESARLFDFLGEDWDESIVEDRAKGEQAYGLGDWKVYEKKDIDAASVKRWKQLPGSISSGLAEICAPTLELFGYDPVNARKAADQSVARRRYEFSLQMGARKDADKG